jgi:hypothetical protein
MTFYQWLTLGLGAAGFVATWVLGAFKLGRAVEQMKSGVKDDMAAEKLARLEAIDALREEFADGQKAQDHNFGEVGAAMRQFIADVEKKVREVEIWGRDHYVQKEDLKGLIDQLRSDFKEAVGEIKDDIRSILGKH